MAKSTKKFNGETFKLKSTHDSKHEADLSYAVAKHQGKKARIVSKVVSRMLNGRKNTRVVHEVWIRG